MFHIVVIVFVGKNVHVFEGAFAVGRADDSSTERLQVVVALVEHGVDGAVSLHFANVPNRLQWQRRWSPHAFLVKHHLSIDQYAWGNTTKTEMKYKLYSMFVLEVEVFHCIIIQRVHNATRCQIRCPNLS